MRVLVCGGRDYADRTVLWHHLDNLGPPKIHELISGMARGADTLAVEWAIKRSVQIHRFPADWKKHGKAAGPIRNQKMLDDGKPHLVIAFPGGKGTADMVRRAREFGVPVMEVYP